MDGLKLLLAVLGFVQLVFASLVLAFNLSLPDKSPEEALALPVPPPLPATEQPARRELSRAALPEPSQMEKPPKTFPVDGKLILIPNTPEPAPLASWRDGWPVVDWTRGVAVGTVTESRNATGKYRFAVSKDRVVFRYDGGQSQGWLVFLLFVPDEPALAWMAFSLDPVTGWKAIGGMSSDELQEYATHLVFVPEDSRSMFFDIRSVDPKLFHQDKPTKE